MSKLARTLVLGAVMAAVNLASMTANAQATDQPASNQDARRPPTERQVGESYRSYHDALAAQAQATEDDAVQRFRRGERASQEQPTIADDTRRPPTQAQVGSPGATQRTLRCSLPSRAVSPFRSLVGWACWL